MLPKLKKVYSSKKNIVRSGIEPLTLGLLDLRSTY